MKPLIRKAVTKIFIAILLCALLTAISTAAMPIMTNDMAMGQLENDDVSFMLWDNWTRVQGIIDIAGAAIGIICVGSVGKDVFNFFNKRKENFTNE